MTNNTVGRVLLAILLSAALLISITMAAVTTLCTNIDFYEAEFIKNQVNVDTGIALPELKRIAIDIVNYLSGRQDTLNCTYMVGTRYLQIFGSQTVSHMADVKALFQRARHLGRLCTVFAALVVLLYLSRKEAEPLCRLIRSAASLMLAAISAFGAVFALSFRGAFITLHRLFFSNNDWLFSPYDYIVLILPDGFFYDFIAVVCIVVIIAAVLLVLVPQILLRKRVKY